MNRTLAYYDLSRTYSLDFPKARALLDQAESQGAAPVPGGAVLTHTAAGGFAVTVPEPAAEPEAS